MNIEEALVYIHHTKWQKSKPGLSRTQELLRRLGNPERELRFIHLAGTNGKGSTAACLASVLQTADYRVGLYTSPFISRFNERMQVNGVPVSDEELCSLITQIQPYADSMEDTPTEFEIITALAFLFFEEAGCDIVVLETGMGGELDSTNVIPTPDIAVLTSISMDHVRELGPTLRDIARTKAGIIKAGGTVVCYPGERVVMEELQKAAEKQNAKLYPVDFQALRNIRISLEGTTFDFDNRKQITIPLIGTYQPCNAAVALTVIDKLKEKGYSIPEEAVYQGMAQVSWPGRFEILSRNPIVVLDGAHNPDGIRATAESLKALFPKEEITFLLGVMADKDVKAMVETIAPMAAQFVTVTPNNPRAMPAIELAEHLNRFGKPVRAFDSIPEGVEFALKTGGTVCVLGSLYFSGDVRSAVSEWIKKR